MASRRINHDRDEAPRPSAKSFEGRESQMIDLAVQCAEEQMRNGTASSQVISHYLKLGSTRERLEQARIDEELKLLRAKTEQIANQGDMAVMLDKAMRMFAVYSGEAPLEIEDDEVA